MSDDYTPTTEQVRGHYAWKSESIAAVSAYVAGCEQFDRWLVEHDRQVAEKAWRRGHLTNWRRGPDNCHCAAYSAGECACGEYGTGKILSLDDNPYALSTALQGVQEESKA